MNNAPAPFHLLAKPTGAACNLDCKYCFFLSKEALYPGRRLRMSDDMLETYLRQLFASQQGPEVSVAWQGGEPTLMGLDFFKRAMELVARLRRPDQKVLHTIQTNGTRIDDAWASFFKRNDFLVGLSVDGPQALHDAYRVDKGGQGSFNQVMRGWRHLVKHGVDVNILCTLHAANAAHPTEVYHFFRDELRATFLQFIPIVERATPETLEAANQGWSARSGAERPLYVQNGDRTTDRTLRPEQYGRFLNAVFDDWVRRDVGRVFVRDFDVTLGAYFGMHSLCIHAPTCGDALALEHNGDVYSCDHFVEPDYLLGNLRESSLAALVGSPRQRAFGQTKQDALPRTCLDCDVRFACNGGCPKDRFLRTPGGEPGLNYLCAGYKLFYHHVNGPMRIMADLLRAGRPPSEIMALLARGEGGEGMADR